MTEYDPNRQPDAAAADRLIAERVRDIRQTALRRISARCAEIGGINLSQGVCDMPAPVALKDAAKQAIDADHAMYTHVAGLGELRTAIARKMAEFNGVSVDPDREIAVTVGSAGAFACVVLATVNPGDEVILFSPFYNYYVDMLALVGAKPRFVHTHAPQWRYDPSELAAAFNERTRMIVVNSPTNPTGKVFGREELLDIVRLAREHDVLIVTDEIYEYITYDAPHISVAALPGAAERTVTLSGGSKTYATTGWRVGYAVGPAPIIEKVLVVNDLGYICAPSPMQYGLLAGLALPELYYTQLKADYRVKRDLLAETLLEIGFEPFVPQGAFYMMADFGPSRYPDALTAAEQILETTGVATVPGAPFYANPAEGESQLRFCFAKRLGDLEEACRRLRRLR